MRGVPCLWCSAPHPRASHSTWHTAGAQQVTVTSTNDQIRRQGAGWTKTPSADTLRENLRPRQATSGGVRGTQEVVSPDPEQVRLRFLSHAQGPPGNQYHHLCPEVLPGILRNTTPGRGWGCGGGDHPSPLLRSPRAAASHAHPAPTGGPNPTCPSAVSSLRCGRHSWVSAPNTEIKWGRATLTPAS